MGVDVEMETKILLIFCLLSIVNAQVVQDNELQRILKSYLNDLKLSSNGIFAQKITQVSEVSNNEVTLRLVTTHCHRDVDPEQIENCDANQGNCHGSLVAPERPHLHWHQCQWNAILHGRR